MNNLSRRHFLVFSATAGLTTFLETRGLANPPLRVGIVGGFEGTFATLKILSSLPELKVAALSNAHHAAMAIAGEVVRSQTGGTPALYLEAAAMIQEQALDLVAAFGEMELALNSRTHLLLDHKVDPLTCIAQLHSGRCIQILPRNAFVGAARATAAELASYEWTKARIRHRTAFPATRVTCAQELHRWMWSEIGEAVDFATEALDTHTIPLIEATAGYGNPAGTVVFAAQLRFPGHTDRCIEVAIHTRAEYSAPSSQTEIVLSHASGSLLFRAAPRPEHLTRTLIRNTLDALTFREPSRLLYSPQSLRPSRELLVYVAEHIGHSQHIT